MHLKLDQLAKVVKRTINEEKAAEALKAEIKRVLGPSVIIEGRLEVVAAHANDRLDVLDRTGRIGMLDFKPSVTATFLNYQDAEVRKLAARVCPEKFLGKMTSDKNPEVRAAVAARLQLPAVREMMKRFPQDDQLRTIFRAKRKLLEAGIAKPTVEPMGHDPVEDAERMGDAARSPETPELSETWYNTQAHRLVRDYNRNIEHNWEELAVRRLVSSMKATSGVEIDEDKLMKSIQELIKEKEDNAMERDALKETLAWLEKQEEAEMLQEGVLPEIVEDADPVEKLIRSGLTAEQYVTEGSKLFRIQEAMLPVGLRKYRISEGNKGQLTVPCIGMLPHGHGFRAVDERALDMFCESWNQRQAMSGEPLRLEWTTHPTDGNKVGFSCILR